MIGPDAIVVPCPTSLARSMRVDLVLTPFRDGYSFEWQDGSGYIWCGGWAAGSRAEAQETAERRLARVSERRGS